MLKIHLNVIQNGRIPKKKYGIFFLLDFVEKEIIKLMCVPNAFGIITNDYKI